MIGQFRKCSNGRWEIVDRDGETDELTSGNVVDVYDVHRGWIAGRVEHDRQRYIVITDGGNGMIRPVAGMRGRTGRDRNASARPDPAVDPVATLRRLVEVGGFGEVLIDLARIAGEDGKANLEAELKRAARSWRDGPPMPKLPATPPITRELVPAWERKAETCAHCAAPLRDGEGAIVFGDLHCGRCALALSRRSP